jgi:hypothetical protein
MKAILVCIILLLVCVSSKAQEDVVPTRINYAEISLSAAGQQFAFTGAYSLNWGIDKRRKFRIGAGVRYTGYYANERDYVTAPAILTSRQTGPQVLFTEIYYENVDTLRLKTTYTNILNLYTSLEYRLVPKLDLGFNIDVFGFGYGRRSIGDYKAERVGKDPGEESIFNGSRQTAKPAPINLLLVSDNDLGSLNSEIYGRYHLSDKWAIRAGATFLFSEFTADRKLALDNNRYRYKSLLGMVGVTFKPFAKHR